MILAQENIALAFRIDKPLPHTLDFALKQVGLQELVGERCEAEIEEICDEARFEACRFRQTIPQTR